MFYLERSRFRGLDKSSLMSFVTFWERYYRESISILPGNTQKIDYLAELNLAGNLTAENITRLLRWKDPRMLTHPRVSGGTRLSNPRVVRVLSHLSSINEFRRGVIDQDSFEHITKIVFPTGLVWRVFLFHMARPWEWPIGDQHVFRAYGALFGARRPETLADFQTYRRSFSDLADQLMRNAKGDADRVTRVASNKRLDNALMAYGQFLKMYDR